MNTSQPNTQDHTAYRSHRLFCTALAALALLVCAGSARACTLNIGSGSTLTICGGTVTTDCVNVAAGGKIVICAGGTLILDGNNGNDTSTVNGRIELTSSNSTLRIKTNDHTMAGTGSIIGQHNSAKIDDDLVGPGDLIVASGFTIQGALRICLDLVNNGTVRADDGTSGSDRLTLDSGRFTGSGVFEVNTANAYLEFDATGVTATALATDFTVSAGTLDVDDDICTTGDLSFTGGTIDVAAGKSFKAGGTCP